MMRIVLRGVCAGDSSYFSYRERILVILRGIKTIHEKLSAGEVLEDVSDDIAADIMALDLDNVHLSVFPMCEDFVVLELE